MRRAQPVSAILAHRDASVGATEVQGDVFACLRPDDRCRDSLDVAEGHDSAGLGKGAHLRHRDLNAAVGKALDAGRGARIIGEEDSAERQAHEGAGAGEKCSSGGFGEYVLAHWSSLAQGR